MQTQGTDLVRWRLIMKLLERMTAPVAHHHALSRVETDVLCFLVNNPSLDTARDIVEYRHIPKASVSQAVELLIQKGMLTRRQDEKDRRHIHPKLTGEATPIARKIADIRLMIEEQMFAGFTPEERAQYQDMSKRIEHNVAERLREQA